MLRDALPVMPREPASRSIQHTPGTQKTSQHDKYVFIVLTRYFDVETRDPRAESRPSGATVYS